MLSVWHLKHVSDRKLKVYAAITGEVIIHTIPLMVVQEQGHPKKNFVQLADYLESELTEW